MPDYDPVDPGTLFGVIMSCCDVKCSSQRCSNCLPQENTVTATSMEATTKTLSQIYPPPNVSWDCNDALWLWAWMPVLGWNLFEWHKRRMIAHIYICYMLGAGVHHLQMTVLCSIVVVAAVVVILYFMLSFVCFFFNFSVLYGNKIKDLPSGVFKGLSSLQLLLLNANEISCIRKDAFRDLHSLSLLSLYDNNIQTLANGTFDAMKSIQTL